MTEHRSQHYVPRCHFRPFSRDGNGQAISLFNVVMEKIVKRAAIKGQCAKNYMYGEDLVLEKAFQKIEGEYARIARLVEANPTSITANDLEVLRLFASLQYFRTAAAIRRTADAHLDMDDVIVNRTIPSQAAQRPPPARHHEIMRSTMKFAIQSSALLRDLKPCLCLNRSMMNFVTSDDPTIFTSRYYFQRVKDSNFGLCSSGATLMLPVTPKAMVIFYDSNVYWAPEKTGYLLWIERQQDILALNEFQYLKAAQNIYFSDEAEALNVTEEFRRNKSRRPSSWNIIRSYVPDGGDESAFRTASDEETKNARSMLVSISSRHPEPSRWPSQLKFRTKPRTYWNGSAVGHVRKPTWLTGYGVRREFSGKSTTSE